MSFSIEEIEDQFTPDLTPPDPNKLYFISPEYKSNGLNLLHKCVLLNRKHPELLKKIINDYDINSQINKGQTALMIAISNSYNNSTEETVKILIESKANLNLQNKNGSTALMLASNNSNKDSTEGTVKILIESRANIDLRNIDGYTAIMLASENSTGETVKMLIENKANLDLQCTDGWTAIMLASRYSIEETVKMLIESKANIDLRNIDGYTAIMLASRYSTEETVKMLIENKANLDLQNNNGETVYMLAPNNIKDFILNYINIEALNEKYFNGNILATKIHDYYKQKMQLIKKVILEDISKGKISIINGLTSQYL